MNPSSATMRSILGHSEKDDLLSRLSLSQPQFAKIEKQNPTVSIAEPAASLKTTLITSNPVVHSVDGKLMSSIKADFGLLYHRHFNGLEVNNC